MSDADSFRLKPNRATPNSGLNRKEKEEERKKELNKMREEARAKRAEEEVSEAPLLWTPRAHRSL